MYWLQSLALLSGVATCAHAGPVRHADDASSGERNGGFITTTVKIQGTLMTLTVVDMPAAPTAHARVDSTPPASPETELPIANSEHGAVIKTSTDWDLGPGTFWDVKHTSPDLDLGPGTFWNWQNYRPIPAKGPHREWELQAYAQEMLGWEEDMQCGDMHEGCSKLPTLDHIATRVKNDTLAEQIYLSMVAANHMKMDQCSRMIKNHPKDMKHLGARCQHIADQVQIPPVEHFLSLCKAGYHWPTHSDHSKLGHRHEIQVGADTRCKAMYEERAAVAGENDSSVAINCHFCHNSKLGEELKKVQRSYVRDYTGNIQDNYNFKYACQFYEVNADSFYKGLADEKGCVRLERGPH